MKEKSKLSAFLGKILVAGALIFGAGNLHAQSAKPEKRIEINIPSYRLEVYDGDRCVTGFPVRVGKPDTPTPVGEGRIYEKRKDISFFYLDGEKEGQKIEQSFIVPKGRYEKMPYERMRALAMDFSGDKSKVIHSTTDYWTIGLPKSHGCVGMKIEDMLSLFDIIDKVPVKVKANYKTFDVKGSNITFYADIYQEAGNELGELGKQIKISDMNSASNRLGVINQELRGSLKKIMKGIEAGKDMSSQKDSLAKTMTIDEFLKPYSPETSVRFFEVVDGDGLVACLMKGGIKKRDALEISGKLGVNAKKLQIGDSFRAEFIENSLRSIEYSGKQGKKRLELR